VNRKSCISTLYENGGSVPQSKKINMNLCRVTVRVGHRQMTQIRPYADSTERRPTKRYRQLILFFRIRFRSSNRRQCSGPLLRNVAITSPIIIQDLIIKVAGGRGGGTTQLFTPIVRAFPDNYCIDFEKYEVCATYAIGQGKRTLLRGAKLSRLGLVPDLRTVQ
jgi:hypothetical protein